MRLSTRFAAPLLALVAFAAPATVPAAHAAQAGVIAHTVVPASAPETDAFEPGVMVAPAGSVLTIVSSGAGYSFSIIGEGSSSQTVVPNVYEIDVPTVTGPYDLIRNGYIPGPGKTPGVGFARIIVI